MHLVVSQTNERESYKIILMKKTDLRNNRAENSLRAGIANLILAIISVVMPFIIRTLMDQHLGIMYLGLNSLLQSLVSLLNMTELGIGSVMVFFLYAPVAEGNIEKTNSYLMVIRKLYRGVAGTITILWITILPFLPKLVTGEVPKGENIYLLFTIYIIPIILQYLLWPEMTSLLIAFQRMDIQNTIAIIAQMIMYFIQIIVISIFHNYTFYISLFVIQAVLLGFLQKKIVDKNYPEIVVYGTITRSEKAAVFRNVVAMIGHQMDEKLLASVDNVFLSAMVGLQVVGIYGNYNMIVSAVTMMLFPVYTGLLSALGNAIVVESVESNLKRFNCVFLLNGALAGWSTACILNTIQIFMDIWMPGKGLSFDIVLLVCILFYMTQMRRSVQTFKNAGGMWKDDQLKPYVSMTVDLILDFILIRMFGVKGAIIATIICISVIELPWEVNVLFHNYFKMSTRGYVGKFVRYTSINIILCLLCYIVCSNCDPESGILSFLFRGIVCTMVSIVLYLLLFGRSSESKAWWSTIQTILTSSGEENE